MGSGRRNEAPVAKVKRLDGTEQILQWMERDNICEFGLCVCTRWMHQNLRTLNEPGTFHDNTMAEYGIVADDKGVDDRRQAVEVLVLSTLS